MSKLTIIDNDLLKNEIKALNDYVNRDEYNLNVVEVMVNEIQDIVKGLKPLGEIAESSTEPIATCPYCGSNNVQRMYETVLLTDRKQYSSHYICKDCHKEFDVYDK